ncbi:MAG: hypothetical protein GX591_12010 [Planctomycetes bacterium]|nr:hypothetical protein [Planctomycetota bacterium]
MSLTTGQKKALHQAARLMGPEFTDAMRRVVQINIGGFPSAASPKASRQGFIAVMAWYETELAKVGRQLARTPTYWRDELKRAPTAALLYRLRRLAGDLRWSEAALLAFVTGPHMANLDGVERLDAVSTYWLGRAIDALAAMMKRQKG